MNRRFRKTIVLAAVSGLLCAVGPAVAAEHGGKEHGGTAQEHGGKEHGGAVQAQPSVEQIRQTIQTHVQDKIRKEGSFAINDPTAGNERALDFVRVHERVGKTGDLYYSCTDMRDRATGELLDLDFDVKADGGNLQVVDARIHKLEGKARYTYDQNDNRIPLE